MNTGIREAACEEPCVCARLNWRYNPNLEYESFLLSETNIGHGHRKTTEGIICVRGFGQTNCLGPHVHLGLASRGGGYG